MCFSDDPNKYIEGECFSSRDYWETSFHFLFLSQRIFANAVIGCFLKLVTRTNQSSFISNFFLFLAVTQLIVSFVIIIMFYLRRCSSSIFITNADFLNATRWWWKQMSETVLSDAITLRFMLSINKRLPLQMTFTES